MGWTNYWYNEEFDIALEIGKFSWNDYNEGTWEALEEFIEYHEKEEPKNEVKDYLWNKVFTSNAYELMVNLFMDIYGVARWNIISEEELKDSTKVIRRKY